MAWMNDALGYNQFGDLDYKLIKSNRQLNKIKQDKESAANLKRASEFTKKQKLMSQAYDDKQSEYTRDYQSLLSLEFPTLNSTQLSVMPFDPKNYVALSGKHRNSDANTLRNRLDKVGLSIPEFDDYKKYKMNELEEDAPYEKSSRPATPAEVSMPYQTTQYNSVDDAKLNRMNEYRNNKSQDEIDADNAMYGNLPNSPSVINNAATYDTADQVKMKRILAERAAKPPGADEALFTPSTYETGIKDGTVSKEGVTGPEDAWYPTKGDAERNMKVREKYDNSNVRNSNMYQNPYEGRDPVLAQKYDNLQYRAYGMKGPKFQDMVQDANRKREIVGVAGTKNRIPDTYYGMTPEEAEDLIQRKGMASRDNPYKYDYADGDSLYERNEAKRMGVNRVNKSSPSPRPQAQVQPSPRPVAQPSPKPEPMRADTNLLNEGWTDTGMSWDGSKPGQIGGRLPYQDNRPAPTPAKVVPPVSQANKDYYDGVGMFNDNSNKVRRF